MVVGENAGCGKKSSDCTPHVALVYRTPILAHRMGSTKPKPRPQNVSVVFRLPWFGRGHSIREDIWSRLSHVFPSCLITPPSTCSRYPGTPRSTDCGVELTRCTAHSGCYRREDRRRTGSPESYPAHDPLAIQLDGTAVQFAQSIAIHTDSAIQRWRQQQGRADWQGPRPLRVRSGVCRRRG